MRATEGAMDKLRRDVEEDTKRLAAALAPLRSAYDVTSGAQRRLLADRLREVTAHLGLLVQSVLSTHSNGVEQVGKLIWLVTLINTSRQRI